MSALLRKVQTLRRRAPGLADDDTWRGLLARVTGGVTSTRAMTDRQLQAVVEALHRAGAPRLAGAAGGRERSRYRPCAQMGKARALWIALADAGVIKDRREAALGGFVRRQTGQDIGIIDATAANKVVEALKAMARRHGVNVAG